MRSAAWAWARRFPFSRSANPKAVRRAANARAWQAEPAAAHVPVDLPVRVRGVPNGKVVHPPFQVPIQLSNQGRDRLETLTGHFRFPIEAESGSLALRLACAPIPMLRQMGCSIPRLLGYMSEQAICMELLSVHKINQAYPGIPTVRERSGWCGCVGTAPQRPPRVRCRNGV